MIVPPAGNGRARFARPSPPRPPSPGGRGTSQSSDPRPPEEGGARTSISSEPPSSTACRGRGGLGGEGSASPGAQKPLPAAGRGEVISSFSLRLFSLRGRFTPVPSPVGPPSVITAGGS